VDREKLPLWWRSEGAGWGNQAATRPSKSNLLLLIRILDLAVAEFAAAETIRPPSTLLLVQLFTDFHDAILF
jgi:hypothetical protein